MSSTPSEDIRLDPRARAFLGTLPGPLFYQAENAESREHILAMAALPEVVEQKQGLVAMLEAMDDEALTPSEGLLITEQKITSQPDGNTISLQIIRPDTTDLLPTIYYIHGGAMMEASCFFGNYRAWGKVMARQNLCVVMVDFRNSVFPSSTPDVAPFPGGLNDCVSGFKWLVDNAHTLNADDQKIMIAGESGGANLSAATMMSLKGTHYERHVSALYLLCPYINGSWPDPKFPSSKVNEGIFISVQNNHPMMAYGLEAFETKNPLAWPIFASSEDLAHFPPTMVSVHECDPLLDEGVEFYRMLLAAGVQAQCRQVMGAFHAMEVFPPLFLDVAAKTAADMRQQLLASST